MSAIAELKPGDVVKITKFAMSEHAPASWALVTGEPVVSTKSTITPWVNVTFVRLDTRPRLYWTPGEETTLDESEGDVWELVPEAYVPDEVWADLARIRLGAENS